MTAAPVGLSPAAAGLIRLLDAAAADGHTVTPVALAGAALSGVRLRLEDAMREVGPGGSGVVSAPSPSLLGFRRAVDAEQALARAMVARASAGRLRVVVGPAGKPRDALAGEGAVADDAELLDVETLAAFFAACADDESVVLAGDLDGLGSPGAGRGLADIAESGLVEVAVAEPADEISPPLRGFAAALARGELTEANDPARALVTVAAASAAEAAHRARQLVGDSIPRAVGVSAARVQVLTPTAAARDALAAALDGFGAPPPLTVHESLGRRWPAVVLVLAPDCSGVLSRPLLHSATTRAITHLSIVHAVGDALVAAARTTPRRRRTLLGTLLASYRSSESSDSHSSSSSSSSSSRPSTGPNGVTSSYAENSASS